MSDIIAFGREITLTLSWDDLPPAEGGPDWQTASGTLEVALQPTDGQLHAIREIDVTAEALFRFGDDLSQLLDELTGSATLEPVGGYDGYGDFELTVTLEYGKGTVSGFLATFHHEARLSFDGVETDQTYPADAQRQLRLLLDQRPG